MPAPPPPNRPQTLKQARAAYKARTEPALSDAERRQVERALELDRRAWRSKEAEKRKVEAAKKRAEKEKEERAKVLLGSQRRCDKFGYKSSQMHLGAFLNKPALAKVQKENLNTGRDGEEDDFGDDDMDDETLLGALDGTVEVPSDKAALRTVGKLSNASKPVMVPGLQQTAIPEPHISTPEDFLSFLNDFDSSTQIARDLDADELMNEPSIFLSVTSINTDEFDDFDLSAEDLEELDATLAEERKASHDRILMPPPPLPPERMRPVPLDTGFTIGELEHLIDDDLQLTQCDPV